MPLICMNDGSLPTLEEIDTWQANWLKATKVMEGLLVVSWVVGLVLIFACRWRQAKSRFIWALWALISLSNAVSIAKIILTSKAISYQETDPDKFETLKAVVNDLFLANLCLISITHWVFAIKYLEVVLKFPLIMSPLQDAIEAKQRRVKCMIRTANASYYTFISLWCLTFYLGGFNYGVTVLLTLDVVVNKAAPAALLVFAVQKFRRSIKQQASREIYSRERLMCIHTTVFICYIGANLAFIVSNFFRNQSVEATIYAYLHEQTIESLKVQRACRAWVSGFFWTEAIYLSNLVTLWLFIFMSLRFTKPLTSYWQNFMLVYQTDHLGSLVRTAETEFAVHERARLYNEAAVIDANRQIQVFMALVQISEEQGSPHQSSSHLEESQIILNTEERDILDDTVDTTTSSILFNRVLSQPFRRHQSRNETSTTNLTGESPLSANADTFINFENAQE